MIVRLCHRVDMMLKLDVKADQSETLQNASLQELDYAEV